jgi:superfamily II DNA/RNA helicase
VAPKSPIFGVATPKRSGIFSLPMVLYVSRRSTTRTSSNTSTIRRNIRYVIRQVMSINSEVVDMICGKISITRKVVIYVRFITDGEWISQKLWCPFYHSKVGSPDEKLQMLEFFKNSGNLMVATNAMGLGIDIPDIRLVFTLEVPSRCWIMYRKADGPDGMEKTALHSFCIYPKFPLILI